LLKSCFHTFIKKALIVVFILFFPSVIHAAYLDDIGFRALESELGQNIPDGSGLLDTHVEASVDVDGTFVWMPDPNHADFSGKTINDRSGSPLVYSSHATNVGRRFYGSSLSLTPGTSTIDSWSANHWLGSGFLRAGLFAQPDLSASRVANHSWVGNGSSSDVILRRTDWVIDTDEFTQVVAMCLSGKPLLGSAFNAIVVGRTSGESGIGTVGMDEVYTAGRARPDISVPLGSLSGAAPVVASAIALLTELGHTNPALSSDPVATSSQNRNGDTIYNAEKSEVLKAALMAGAGRVTYNTTEWDIRDYRTDPDNRFPNGLDKRFGAGQLDISHSYHILEAGEQNSKEDVPLGAGEIERNGFDYDPFFGGSNGSNDQATYSFAGGNDHRRIYASLVWNIKIQGGTAVNFDGTAALFHLDLALYDTTNPSDWVLVTESSATGENSQNLWWPLRSGHDYILMVSPGEGQPAFEWDYALAWRMTTPRDSDQDGMDDDWEVQYGLAMDDDSDAQANPDDDGLTNQEEYVAATDPVNPDTDGDGFSDGMEVSSETDPLNPNDFPSSPASVSAVAYPELVFLLLFFLGSFLLIRKNKPSS
jgi:hypothetical protein